MSKLKLENCEIISGKFIPTLTNWMNSKMILDFFKEDISKYEGWEDHLFVYDNKDILYKIKKPNESVCEKEIPSDTEKKWMTFEKDEKKYAIWWFKGQEEIFKNMYKQLTQ